MPYYPIIPQCTIPFKFQWVEKNPAWSIETMQRNWEKITNKKFLCSIELENSSFQNCSFKSKTLTKQDLERDTLNVKQNHMKIEMTIFCH